MRPWYLHSYFYTIHNIHYTSGFIFLNLLFVLMFYFAFNKLSYLSRKSVDTNWTMRHERVSILEGEENINKTTCVRRFYKMYKQITECICFLEVKHTLPVQQLSISTRKLCNWVSSKTTERSNGIIIFTNDTENVFLNLSDCKRDKHTKCVCMIKLWTTHFVYDFKNRTHSQGLYGPWSIFKLN